MSILEKLGLARKKNPGAPVIGEKKKKQEESSSLRHNIYIRVAILLGFLLLIFLTIPQASFKEPVNYKLNEPWRSENLTAPFNFPIQKTEEEIEQEEAEVEESISPIFHLRTEVQNTVQSDLDSLFQNLDVVLQSYAEWQRALEENQTATQDSLAFVRRKNNSGLRISQRSWEALLQNYRLVELDNQSPNTKTAPNDRFIGSDLQLRLKNMTEELLDAGIIDRPKNELTSNQITIRNLNERTERSRNIGNVRDLQETQEYIENQLNRFYYEEIANAGREILNQVLRPNLIYSESDTESRIEEAISNISKNKGAVAQGQVIIRRGDIVTPEKLNMLRSLAEARSQNATQLERWLRYGGDILAMIAILTIFFFYLYLYRKSIFENNAMLLLVLIAMSLIIVSSSLIYSFDSVSQYIVPVAITPIILTIIFDSRVGLLATITLALITGLIHGSSFEYVVATMVACSLGLFSVRDIKKRSQFFFITPGIVFICYAFVLLSFNLTAFEGISELLGDLFFVGINSVFILFTYPLILLFEKSFNVTTDFTLIELSDNNLPLLKDLMNKAPGTFHHSLQVANMAEAAAGAIGANGLLTRVGALYHDIGKMEKPGYFTENQSGSNEHDKLKPRMSALVIKAHVSDGVKMAREHGLPEVIIDFIKTHHGTSLIRYFYQKAKEQADEDKDEIHEEDFRYDGPLPRTKETGILLLADGVEAASRSMKDPNYQKLENLINKIVDDRVYEGQLSKTPLTFQDIRVIKETFLNILLGIHHSRVEYPDDEKKKEGKSRDKTKDINTGNLKFSKGDQSGKSQPPVDEFHNS